MSKEFKFVAIEPMEEDELKKLNEMCGFVIPAGCSVYDFDEAIIIQIKESVSTDHIKSIYDSLNKACEIHNIKKKFLIFDSGGIELHKMKLIEKEDIKWNKLRDKIQVLVNLPATDERVKVILKWMDDIEEEEF